MWHYIDTWDEFITRLIHWKGIRELNTSFDELFVRNLDQLDTKDV